MSLQDNIKAAQIDMVAELGIDKLPEAQQKDLLVQISEVLQQRIVLRLVEEMPDEKRDEFTQVLEKSKEDQSAVEKFLAENIPKLEEIVVEEIGKYKKEAKEFIDNATEDKAEE
jgi:transcriptional regulator of heat shock response